jgi:hypothetical protein
MFELFVSFYPSPIPPPTASLYEGSKNAKLEVLRSQSDRKTSNFANSPSPACGGGWGWGFKHTINPGKIEFGVNHAISSHPFA